MEDYRLDQSGQEVQDILNGAAMQVDLTAETERATEAEQTLQGNIDAEETRAEGAEGTLQDNIDAEETRAQGAEGTLQDNIDAEETRAKAAEKQNADDIDAIEEKIPSGASSSNKLTTEEYVNDSVATATATFRGTYNVVTNLSLLPSATHSQISASLKTEIATADSNDYAFVLIPTSVETPEEIEKIERYKYNGSVWGFEYVLNNSGFTAAQWAAINSGITSGDVTKLANLPTNDQLTTLLNGKQDSLTFDNVPTQGSSNPVKSGGVYSAIKSEETRAMAAESQNANGINALNALVPAGATSENKLATIGDVDEVSSAIEAILLLIPSAASALNQLADKAFVNSSIATATATFRGTYNLVTDLSLNVNATHSQIAGALGINISTADNNDYAFVQIPTSLETPTEIRVTERYKFNGTAWAFEYDLNNSGFTSAQWAAINSGITIALVGKLNDLPTNAALTALLGQKQDTLTFDNVPTLNSNNPVKSGGIYNVIKAITDLIPADATAQNQLADKADVAAKIVAAIPSWKGQYDALTDLQAVTGAKAGDMGCVKTTDSDGHAVLTFYQYSAQGAWVVYYTLRHYAQNKPATTGTTGDYPYNGMGRIELQKNIVNGVNTLTQAMLTQENTIYVIQYDFTLGANITVPANCVLEFDGGSVSGANTITGANTGINAGLAKIFGTDVTLAGSWNVAEAYPEWFGAVGNDVEDDTVQIQKIVNVFNNVVFKNVYKIESLLIIPKETRCTFVKGYFDVASFDTTEQIGGWVYFDNPTYSILPEWFGAKGDGTTDDTKAIQNAIDANLNPTVFPIGRTQSEAGMQHTSYNKLSIEFNHNYLITSTLEIRAEQHFNPLTLYSNNKALITGGGESEHTNIGIRIAKPDNYPSGDIDTQVLKTIKGIWFTYFDTAIYDGGTDWDSSISGNFFQDIYTAAIYVANCNGTLIENNFGCWVYGYLIDLYYSSSCRVIGNHSGETSSTGARGININNGTNSPNIIANNTLNNCGIKVSKRNGGNSKGGGDIIKGNNIIRSEIGINCSDNDTNGVIIEGNTLYYCTTGVITYKENTINNNMFIGCDNGIQFTESGRMNTASNNTFMNCINGIVWGFSQYNSLLGCIFNTCTKAISAGNNGYMGFISNCQFINCTTVHDFTQTAPEAAAQFAYNYSSQQGMVLGRELN